MVIPGSGPLSVRARSGEVRLYPRRVHAGGGIPESVFSQASGNVLALAIEAGEDCLGQTWEVAERRA